MKTDKELRNAIVSGLMANPEVWREVSRCSDVARQVRRMHDAILEEFGDTEEERPFVLHDMPDVASAMMRAERAAAQVEEASHR